MTYRILVHSLQVTIKYANTFLQIPHGRWILTECFCWFLLKAYICIQPMLVMQPRFHKWNCISICPFPNTFIVIKSDMWGNSLAVQWLRLHAPNAGGLGLIPGLGTEIPRATWHSQEKKNLMCDQLDYFPLSRQMMNWHLTLKPRLPQRGAVTGMAGAGTCVWKRRVQGSHFQACWSGALPEDVVRVNSDSTA